MRARLPPVTESHDLLAAALARGTDSLNIPHDAHLVLAVSGGPDSMALFHGAAHLVGTDARQWSLTVAHLDHGLRDESADDAAFVADVAAGVGVPCEVGRTDVAALARAEGRSVEDAGREARYRFFAEITPVGAVIATAHTADDAAETVIMNLLRGTGPTGVRGIPARRGPIIRPLLAERRATLRGLLDGGGIAYRIDASNEDPAFLRNRIRAEVMPMLEALRPGAVDRVGQFARHAADDEALLDDLAAAELARRRSADGEIDWRDPPVAALGRRVLRMAIGDPAPNAERIEALLEAAEGSRGGVRIELGGGRIASVRQRRIRIE
jgi:tRNA(Ile)-lysidine synthase